MNSPTILLPTNPPPNHNHFCIFSWPLWSCIWPNKFKTGQIQSLFGNTRIPTAYSTVFQWKTRIPRIKLEYVGIRGCFERFSIVITSRGVMFFRHCNVKQRNHFKNKNDIEHGTAIFTSTKIYSKAFALTLSKCFCLVFHQRHIMFRNFCKIFGKLQQVSEQ